MLRLFLAANLDSVFALPDFSDDVDAHLNLLQSKAVRHNHSEALSSQWVATAPCYLSGDVHIIRSFYSGAVNHHKNGLFEVLKSVDERFNVQAYQCPAVNMNTANGWINGFAFEIDGTKIVILPPSHDEIQQESDSIIWQGGNEFWQQGKYRKMNIITDEGTYLGSDLPVTIPGTSIEIRKNRYDYEIEIVTEGFKARLEQTCYTNMGTYCYYNFGIWVDRSNVPPLAESNSLCTTNGATTQLAADKPVLFSSNDLDHICKFCKDSIEQFHNKDSGIASNKGWFRNGAVSNLDNFECVMPPDPPPPPPAKAVCEERGCSWDHGQELCHSLKGDDAMYNDCLFDFCQRCQDMDAEEFVEFEEEEHPSPICVQGAVECVPNEVCTKSVKMNTLSVTQNNLGGVGPDEGAEEIRYGNAAVVNGKAVDLVLTTDGTFTTSKPKKNGQSGAFGIINVKCGTSVLVKMRVVDSESGAPVTLERIAVSWYDLDEGKKAKGRATVTTCGSTGAIISDNSELTVERKGDCSTATSSTAGTGKDNPKSPHQLDSLQISRTLTLPFVGVSEWTSTLALAKGFKGRNFMFAIEPSVACGPED